MNVDVASLGLSRASIRRSSLDPRKLRYRLAHREIARIVGRFEPDLVHAHYVSSYGLVGALLNRHPPCLRLGLGCLPFREEELPSTAAS